MTLLKPYINIARPVALLLPTLLAALCSCSGEEEMMRRGEGTVRISANVVRTVETRAYQAQGEVESGLFLMTYPNYADNTTYSVCDVNFYNGYGVTTTTAGKELKWQEIGSLADNDNSTVFYLDNVPRPAADPGAIEVQLTDAYNPFTARVFDETDGSNDLLWGTVEPKLFAEENIVIPLQHRMSRVSVVVTVDNSADNAAHIDFSQASVKITHVVHKGISYSRLTGTIDLGPDPVYEDLQLATRGDWQSVNDDETNSEIKYFETKNFALPPQQLLTDENRPRLVLEVPQADGSVRSYSGVLPRVMTVNGSPAMFGFDAGKNLTLRVKISADLLRIETIFATVQDWVDKGTFLVTGSQAGIYADAQISSLISVYNSGNATDLRRFGYLDGDTWVFNVFTVLTLSESEMAGAMANGPDFRFDLNSRGATIVTTDGASIEYDENIAPEAVYELLRNGTVIQNQPTE